MPSIDVSFDRVEEIWEQIRQYASEPEFSEEVRSRERAPRYEADDAEVLWEMIKVIAYSQAVPADRIGGMIDRGVFRDVFGSCEPTAVARMDVDEIYRKHWSGKLSGMRFPDKIEKMVACAKSLQSIAKRHGSFMDSLKAAKLPERLRSDADIEQFWDAFQSTCDQSPPYFQKNFTSMCHLLQTFRFPCAKPDKIVMMVAAEIGFVSPRKQYPERELRRVVELMQSYAVRQGLSVPIVDLIFLIHGKQTWAKTLVRPSYYSN
jgi:hypothetical protein